MEKVPYKIILTYYILQLKPYTISARDCVHICILTHLVTVSKDQENCSVN